MSSSRAAAVSFLHRAFVAPWKSRQRAALYAGTFLGVAGFSVISLAFSWRLAGAGAWDLFVFWAVFFAFGGLGVCPLLYGLYAARGQRTARLGFSACVPPGL